MHRNTKSHRGEYTQNCYRLALIDANDLMSPCRKFTLVSPHTDPSYVATVKQHVHYDFVQALVTTFLAKGYPDQAEELRYQH